MILQTIIGATLLGFLSIVCCVDAYKSQMALNKVKQKVHQQTIELNAIQKK